MAGAVRIGLLGPLDVRDASGRLVAVGGPRLRLLLILLALDAGRVVPAYSLIERLWEDDPPANAANALQSAVSRLRASLREAGLDDGVIESHPAGYRLRIPPRCVDVVAFEELSRAGRQTLASGDPAAAKRLLTQALGLWRGPALADAANAGFAAAPAARLSESRTRASLDLIEAGLALGEGDNLVGELRAMIASNPLAERPRGLLMRALYAAGRPAEALAVYEQTRTELADRLGADPSPELERIYLGVLRRDLPTRTHSPAGGAGQPSAGTAADGPGGGAPGSAAAGDRGPGDCPDAEAASGPPAWNGSLAVPPLAGLRRPLTSFVGRDGDIARVRRMLARGRLVTLTGPGGAGKTRLAVELAALLAANAARSPGADGSRPAATPAALAWRPPTGEASAAPASSAGFGGAGDATADQADGTFRDPAESTALVRANADGDERADGMPRVWFVELAPVADPQEVPFAVLSAVGIRESPVIARAGGQAGGPPDPAERLVAALGQRRGLLILDNCEHVVAAAAALADQVLAGCPEVRVLATSREPLRISGEALWPVASLPAPPLPPGASAVERAGAGAPGTGAPGWARMGDGAAPDHADDLLSPSRVADYPAVRLLADRAAAVRPEFRVDESNAADVARICHALDGLPLAIELAAARLRTLSAAQLAKRLDARFELLTGGSRTAAQRHQTLRAVVEWSWDLLSEAEQVLARRLAVFPGGAELSAAEDVCRDGTLPAEAVLPALFGLVEKSFLAVDSEEGPRYRMLETVRAYCLERLAESGEQERVRRAFAGHFLRLAETADPLLRGREQPLWMRRLSAEHDNLHAALRWAIDHRDVAMALRFGQALGWYWLLRGQRRESAALCRDILAISDRASHADPAGGGAGGAAGGAAGGDPADSDPPGGGPAPGELGVGGQSRLAPGGDFQTVNARAVCALTVLNTHWDIAEVSQPLTDAWELVMPAGRPREDDGSAGRPPNPLVLVGVALVALYARRDPELACEALAAQFSSPDPWIRSGARLMHTVFAMSLGRMDGVAQACAEALAGFRAIGDRWGAALALMGQADLASLDGDHAGAIAALEQAVELSREMSDWDDTAQMRANLAKARSRLGDIDGAITDLAHAERIAKAQGQPDSDLWLSYIRAELAWLRGDLVQVTQICERLDGVMAGKPPVLGQSLRALFQARGGVAAVKSGDVARGQAVLASALGHARDSQHRLAVAAVIDALAAAALQGGRGRGEAEMAATLLGAAHSVRGAFDHASLDAPEAAQLAAQVLGDDGFDAAYQRGRALGYQDALAFAAGCATLPVSG